MTIFNSAVYFRQAENTLAHASDHISPALRVEQGMNAGGDGIKGGIGAPLCHNLDRVKQTGRDDDRANPAHT